MRFDWIVRHVVSWDTYGFGYGAKSEERESVICGVELADVEDAIRAQYPASATDNPMTVRYSHIVEVRRLTGKVSGPAREGQ